MKKIKHLKQQILLRDYRIQELETIIKDVRSQLGCVGNVSPPTDRPIIAKIFTSLRDITNPKNQQKYHS